MIKKGEAPESFTPNPNKKAQKDDDVRRKLKNNKRHYGYKNPINADMKTKLITKFTNNSVNILIRRNSRSSSVKTKHALCSAYTSQTIKQHLNERNCNNHIHVKGYRGNPQDTQQRLTNHMKAKIRVRVEHLFGYMTNSMNEGLNLKAIGEKRIGSLIGLLNLTYSLFRYELLKA